MKYNEFKEMLNSVKEVDEVFYGKLLSMYGDKKLSEYFEKYLLDDTVEDNIDKIKRTNYYLNITQSKDEKQIGKLDDNIKMYFEDAAYYDLLTQEQEVELFTMIRSLEEKLNSRNASAKTLKEDFKKYGIKLNMTNVDSSIAELEIIEKQLKNDLTKEEELNNVQSILISARILESYFETREFIVNSNLKLVISIAKGFQGHGLELLDLIEEGNIGLLRAIDKFDPNLGYKFSTYATWWIRQAVKRGLAEKSRPIRLPAHIDELYFKITGIERQIQSQLSREITDDDVIQYLRNLSIEDLKSRGILEPTEFQITENMIITEEKYKELKSISQTPVSLDIKVGETGDSTIGDFVEDTERLSPEEIANHGLLINNLKEDLNVLTVRERIVVVLRNGLDFGSFVEKYELLEFISNPSKGKTVKKIDEQEFENMYNELCLIQVEHTLDEIGSFIGVTRERVRQIEAKAMYKLKKSCKRKKRI